MKALNMDYAVDVLFLDFRKAFDSVPHQRLLVKLNNIGIGGKLLGWIKNYLHKRMQQVCVS